MFTQTLNGFKAITAVVLHPRFNPPMSMLWEVLEANGWPSHLEMEREFYGRFNLPMPPMNKELD